MKNLRLFLLFLTVVTFTKGFSQIGIQTNTPDASSALDIVSTNKGLLVPRVTLTANLSDPSPITSPATGLLVFNSGANQPQGFYYWNGTAWVKFETGGGTITTWLLAGNAGTTAGTNFVGTTDAQALVFKTNNVERMRILSNGQIVIDNGYTPPYADNKFTVTANTVEDDAVNGYSTAGFGIYGWSGSSYAVYANAGNNIAMRARSQHETGNGILATGNNVSGIYPTSGSGGAFTGGNFGIYSKAIYEGGTGIAASGNNLSISTMTGGSGGAFTGANYGAFTAGENITNGIGIGSIGNGGSTLYVPPTGSGGAFTGDSLGIFGKGVGSDASGIVGLGNGGNTYHYPTAGSGGSFTGVVGIYGYSDQTNGNAVVGLVNGSTYSVPGGTGSGGSFTGPIAVYGSSSSTSGTAVIGVGNDGGSYNTLTNGSGGAFSGFHGVYGYATDATTGQGVVGLGNNGSTRYTLGDGGGGSFTGNRVGVEAFGTNPANDTYGVYGEYNGGGSNDGIGVYGRAWPNYNYGYGVLGQGRWYGVYASGRLGASGTKSFEIDHPLDPENKKLKHYTIESPEVLNLYRGNVFLDNNGEAFIKLPDYFLSINIDFSYVLTPIGRQAPGLFIKEEIDDEGKFVIAGGNPDQKISWVVYAKRNDRFMQRERINEPDLVEVEKKEFEKGKYIQPELYNQPPEKGIFYIKNSGQQTKDQKNKVNRGDVRTLKNTGQRIQKVNETKAVEKEKK